VRIALGGKKGEGAREGAEGKYLNQRTWPVRRRRPSLLVASETLDLTSLGVQVQSLAQW
jgi:hypothetical protein